MPAPEPRFARYGGNTSCVALAHDGEPPSLVLDAGTGLRVLSTMLGSEPFVGSILLGHVHLDHILGLPFFPAAERPGGSVQVYVPSQGDPVEVLGRVLSPPTFPLRPDELRGDWRFHSLEPGHHRVAGFDVLALEVPHLAGRMFGYRISDPTATITYVSDHSPILVGEGPDGLGARHTNALALARDTDMLIHDAQHVADEFPAKAFLGHSCVEYALDLGRLAGARKVMLFHHDPGRGDDELDAIVATARADSPIPVVAAVEGAVHDLLK
ncbi:MAG: hypothetical protein E6G27_18320 [Actinobacteria bacterium]|nr:MAG: hypothetical protein E6G27_18320 [Actinomycetota bacterium]